MIFFYRLLYFFLLPFIILYALFFSKKLRQYFFNRKSNFTSSKQKCIWLHSSSGEFEHAKALLKKIKENYPKERIIVTYSSPSYEPAIAKFKYLDGYLPLPLDLPSLNQNLIKQINPKLVFFAKGDLWPDLLHKLHAKNIPTVLFAKTEKPKLFLLERHLYKFIFSKLTHISFVNENSRKTFLKRFPHPSTSVDGDPRVEEALARVSKCSPKENRNYIVLGSIWKEDINTLQPALSNLLSTYPNYKLIVAPHEPNKATIDFLKNTFKNSTLYSQDTELTGPVVIVDTFGALFNLYSFGAFAFLGGSFKKRVHSVLEPLCHGLEVVVGPHHENNFDALTYKKKPFEFVHVVTDSKSAESIFKQLIENSSSKKEQILSELNTKRNSSELLLKSIQHIGDFF